MAVLGMILPVLPCTPFVLLASYFAVRGSKRLDTYIKSTKLYTEHVACFVKDRAMTLKTKISILGFASVMLMFPLILTKSIFFKVFIVLLLIVKYVYFIFMIETIETVVSHDR